MAGETEGIVGADGPAVFWELVIHIFSFKALFAHPDVEVEVIRYYPVLSDQLSAIRRSLPC
jgi:hypothetical protein